MTRLAPNGYPYPVFPPPDGYGPWHAWDPRDIGPDGLPPGLDKSAKVYALLRRDKVPTFSWECAEGWSWEDVGSNTITFFCLEEGHPYNHTIPEAPKPTVDMTGMDEHELWGAF